MKLPKFRNAIVYRATLPGIEATEKHLKEMPWSEIRETEFARASFIPHPVTGELVTPLANGFAIVIQHDQKLIPRQVVMKQTEERAAKFEAMSGEKLKKSERRRIAEEVTVDLCKQAFVRSSLILILYNSKDRLLVVNTTSKKVASMACSMLIKVIGSIKTETIHIDDIKNGLTTRLKNHIAGSAEAFNDFEIGEFIQMSRLADQKETVRYAAEFQSVESEIADSLNSNFTVDKMELYGAGVKFLLTEDFSFRRINTNSTIDDETDDKAAAWRHLAGADLFQFSAAVNKLCELLSYKEQEKPAA
jgi:recombination associated protein RdgC